ncbi:hypothetical protein BGZ73_008684 [Actinomortierella ambigua]|nr:hypothetical protein BGZ73_008684 [Actinomortierella ambigua]
MKFATAVSCLLLASAFVLSPANAILRKCGKDLPCPDEGSTCCRYLSKEPSEYGACLPNGCPEGWEPFEPIPTA